MKLLGLNITRAKERKEDPTWRAILAVLGGRDAVSTPADYAKLTEAGYRMCATSYACIRLIAKSAAGIKWVVYKKQAAGELKKLDDHPLGKLLAKPNEFDHGMQLNEKIVSFKLLAGNSYILKVGSVASQPPKFLYALRPDRVKIKPGTLKDFISGYIYTASGLPQTLAVQDVLHLKEFHPLDDFYGLSRLEVAAKSIDLSNWAAEWNLKLLQNDMRPSGGFKVGGTLTDEQYERLKADIKAKYQGAENVNNPLLLEGGMEWQPFSFTPKDIDWLNAEKFNLRRICSVFNVWSGLFGDTESTTYSNYQEGRKGLYQEAVLPEMDTLRDAYNTWLVPTFGDGLYLDYDRDAIEALQEDRGQKYTYLASANWMKVNEKRKATGLEELGDEGEAVLIGLGTTTLDEVVGGKEEDEEEPAPNPFARVEDEEEEKPQDEEDGDKSARPPIAGKAKRIVIVDTSTTDDLERHLSRVSSKITKPTRALWADMADVVTPEDAAQAVRQNAIPNEWRDKWEKQIEQYVNGSVKRAALETISVVGDRIAARLGAVPGKAYQFAVTREAILDWMAAQGARLIVELREKQFAAVKALLAKYGLGEQATPYELAKQIRRVVGLTEREATAVGRFQEKLIRQGVADDLIERRVQKYADLLHKERASRIARTELANAYNRGQMEAIAQAKAEGWIDGEVRKTWIAGGPRVCDDCYGMDGEEVGLDENFSNGEQGPTYHPNCACGLSYEVVKA